MKILIGVMYCIENEYEQCLESIKRQSYRHHDYFVVEKLPNKEAHDTLYSTFMKRAEDYDFFIKIDADMVLVKDSFFEDIIAYFSKHPDVDDLQIAVHDFFCDRLIYGLHVYSSRMVWEIKDEKLFVDRCIDSNLYKQVNDCSQLAPAAWHCPNPSHFQAYHFGLHKAVKVTQRGQAALNYNAAFDHWDNLISLIQNFRAQQTLPLAFAIIGAYEAIRQGFSAKNVDFQDQTSIATFDKWRQMPEQEVIQFAGKIAWATSLIPDSLFLELILLPINLRNGIPFSTKVAAANLIKRRFSKYQERKRLILQDNWEDQL
jgi:hypothetical protein